MFGKKQKKKKEPKYIISPLGTPLLNYKVYCMSFSERLRTFLTALLLGGGVSLVFYGNQFLDSSGRPTGATATGNVVIFLVVGSIAGILAQSIRSRMLQKKRITELSIQFRGFLEALAVALSSGMNMNDSLQSVYKDLVLEYTRDSWIVKETEEMISGMRNNIPIEDMIRSLGERSDNRDIRNFATVFNVSYRAGGNIRDIVRRTADIIGEKIEISGEIATAISSNKLQFNAMMVIPVFLILMLRAMGGNFAKSFSTPLGVIATTFALGIFVLAFLLGQKIMDIKG